jgi:cold shock CspA family protein
MKEEPSQPRRGILGLCRAFNAARGFGFITALDDPLLMGRDIFVHRSALCVGLVLPGGLSQVLHPGEYVCMDVVAGAKGPMAQRVTGVLGGPLMCDFCASKRLQSQLGPPAPPPPPPLPPFPPRHSPHRHASHPTSRPRPACSCCRWRGCQARA